MTFDQLLEEWAVIIRRTWSGRLTQSMPHAFNRQSKGSSVCMPLVTCPHGSSKFEVQYCSRQHRCNLDRLFSIF